MVLANLLHVGIWVFRRLGSTVGSYLGSVKYYKVSTKQADFLGCSYFIVMFSPAPNKTRA